MVLSFNFFSWHFKLVTGGLLGYVTILNYLSGISIGTIALLINLLILFFTLFFTGKLKGIRTIYAFVFASLALDCTRKWFGLDQISCPNILYGAVFLSLQAIVAALGASLFVPFSYNAGGNGAIHAVIFRFTKMPLHRFVLLMDSILAVISFLIFGWQYGFFVFINGVVFSFSLRFFLPRFREMFLKAGYY